MKIDACDVCKKTDVALMPYTLVLGDDRRLGDVCEEDAKAFAKLMSRLPPPPQKKRRLRFEDSVVDSPEDIPRG